MDFKSNLPVGDADMKEPAKNAEYESLLDINEKHEFPEDKPEVSKDEVTDIEAGHQAPEADDAPAPKAPRAPLSREEALALRIKPMDNIRTFALCLILLQNSAIQAISTHREASQVHETWPKMFVFISLFVGLTRVVAVPLLFFVAGFTSHFAMVMHERSPIRFALRRTWKTARTVVLYQTFAYLAKLLHPLPITEATDPTPYYASRDGILAILNGPTAYIIAILTLDYIYALFRAANVFISNSNTPTHFITTKTRYEVSKFASFFLVENWVLMGGYGFKRDILPGNATLEHCLYALNSADLHFPFLYIIAYTAGIHFVHYYKFILATAQRKRGFSPMTVLQIRIALSLISLYSLCHIYPGSMIPFLDVRQRPTLVFSLSGPAAFYGIWMTYVLLVVPEAVVGAFFTTGALAKDWGNFSRTAHFQVYIQMFYVVGNTLRIFDNLFVRWLVIGYMAIYYAHVGGIGAMYLGNLGKRGLLFVRNRISRKAEQPISV